MKAAETKIQSIIEGTNQYVVPLFQRPYSWEKQQWEVLWQDLIWLCENEDPKNHFIGSIVTMPTVSVPEGVAKYLLIDGQQRLTTIFILLVLLRNVARQNNDPELGEEIEKTMLVNQFKKGIDHYKLLPTQIDRNAFQSLVDDKNIEASRIFDCYQYFERKLKLSQFDVKLLSTVVTTRLSVVSIRLESDDNPHLVFESLNAKGRPLTQSDLIRNYFFMRMHVDIQEEIHAKYWEPMQTALGESLTECIRHYLMRNGTIVKQNDVYFTLKDRVVAQDALISLKEIATFATYYEKLINPFKESHHQVQAALQRINRLEVTTAYPFLLNCYHDYAEGRLSVNEFIEVLRAVENFVIRRFVCNRPSSELNKIFPALYNQAHTQAQLKGSTDFVRGVCIALQSRGYPKDPEFTIRLANSKLYGAGERLVKTKLILESIEGTYKHKEQTAFGNLTIEHVMPQTLTDWWREHLGEDWQADHELYLNTIGNLTLTAYNSELSNDSFPKKKSHFESSHVELNRYFSSVIKWNGDAIEKRSQILADSALRVWPYFGEEELPQQTNGDGATNRIPRFVTVLGQRESVETWRDVEMHVLNTLAELEPDSFSILAEAYPRFISKDRPKLREGRLLRNGYFAEVHLSAKAIHKFCSQAFESAGLSDNDWLVETEQR